MRVVVFGSRYATYSSYVSQVLDLTHKTLPFTVLISGNAPGIDYLAECWAASRGIPIERFPADWAKQGNSAGPIRNQRMIDEGKPNFGIAFPGGKGTRDMKIRMQTSRIYVLEAPQLS